MRSLIVPAHGKGATALVRVERPKLADLQPQYAEDTDRGLAVARRRGRPFQTGNRAAENKQPSLARLGVEIPPEDDGDDGSAPSLNRKALRKAENLRRRLGRDMRVAYGGEIGAGPSAVLGAAARAYAAALIVYQRALDASAACDAAGAAKLFATASTLDERAKQAQLTAIALAEREKAARDGQPKNDDDLAVFRKSGAA